MDTNPINIAKILVKKSKGEMISEEEDQLFHYWLAKDLKNKALYEELLQKKAGFADDQFTSLDIDSAWQIVRNKRQSRRRKRSTWYVAASLALILCAGASWFLLTDKKVENTRFVESQIAKHKNDILPAGLGARVILASGKEVQVDDTLSVATNDQFVGIAYQDRIPERKDNLILNTLIVPAANFFKLTLSDGTVVWVNSNSELRFPTRFGVAERRVFLQGEAYFEVAKDMAKPFYVETDDTQVRVLGTHFNISSYGRHSKTSLAEGRVEVSANNKSVIISPGQSVQWNNGDLKIKQTNLQKDLAWKNNEFYFKEDNIVNISHQLKLWYDLEISLSQDVSLTETYSGEIRRDARLSEVLQMLEYVSDLDFRLNKNKLSITKHKG